MKKYFTLLILIFSITSPSIAISANISVLSSSDSSTYNKIFKLQQEGKWKSADKLIKKIDDKILFGHIYYQRYMHPTKYRASYKELHNWLLKYSDQPGSKQLFKLAVRRRPSGWKRPKEPLGILVPKDLRAVQSQSLRFKKSDSKHNSIEREILRKIYQNVQRGNVTIALNYLNKNRKSLSKPAHAEAFGHIARGYYRYHKASKTISIAEKAYKMDKAFSWEANWWAGLDAYRVEKYEKAAILFERMATSINKKNEWLYSAGYFWAGRSQKKLGNIMSANSYWAKATLFPTTFYGLVASQAMGNTPSLYFSTNTASHSDLQTLLRIPGFKRAVALVDAGSRQRADSELKYIQPQVKFNLQYFLMQSALSLNLPHSQYRIGCHLTNKKQNISTGYLFPDVPYKPMKGWEIDRSLVFAFVRQESQFRAYAKSSVGARGLMQLMPATARFIARKTKVKPNSFHGTKRNYLYRPELSMSLGQSYIKYLLEKQGYNKNLFLAISSYNAGPGNISKWRKKVKYKNDPLIFIESLPSHETRLFMEKVVSNFWIYRLKFNGYAPSLKQVANGEWPIYKRLD